MREQGRRPDEERRQVAIAWRDWALRRLRRLTTTVVAGSVLALAALSALAASARPGAKTHPVTPARRPAAAQAHVTLPRAIPVPRSRRQSQPSDSSEQTTPVPAAPVAPAPQPAPVAPQPTVAPPVTSSGGS
jgi:uncharacterized protein (DUF3084 family)